MLVNCPHCNQEVEIQIPETVRRGQLAGISLQDMTDEQLKRELVNSKSVLYKAEKRGASEDILARNKDFIKCIFKPKPTFLGNTISITGNGDITNDK